MTDKEIISKLLDSVRVAKDNTFDEFDDKIILYKSVIEKLAIIRSYGKYSVFTDDYVITVEKN